MSYKVIRRVGNNLYAYEVVSVWDKKKGMPVQKTIRYLGPVDEKGNIRERKQKPFMVVDYGDVMTAKSVFEKTKLPRVIERLSFDNEQKQLIEIMLLNKVVSPLPDYQLEDWINGNYLSYIYDISLDSREISRMLKGIGRKDIADIYFEIVRRMLRVKNVVAYDIATLPTTVDLILSEWGRCGNGKDKVVKLAVFFDVQTKTPLYFRLITGNVQDVSTLSDLIEYTCRFLPKNVHFCLVLDRGFYSSPNIEALKKMHGEMQTDFIIPIPKTTSLFYRFVRKNIVKAKNHFLINGKYVYGTKTKYGSSFIYVFYSPQKSLHDIERANIAVMSGKVDKKNLDKKLSASGYTVMMSTMDTEPEEILKKYHQRSYLEKSYSYLKSKIKILPIRHHTEETAIAHIFISILSLSLYWYLHEKLKRKYSLEHAFLLLRRIKAKIYDDDRVFLTEIGKKQREILKMLNLDLVSKICGI